MTTLPQTAPIRVPRPVPAAGQISVPSSGAIGPAAGDFSRAGGMTPADIWRVIRANMALIILALIAGGVAGYFINAALMKYAPKYKASADLVIRSANEMPEPMKPTYTPSPDELALLQNQHASYLMSIDTAFLEALEADMNESDTTNRPNNTKPLRQTNWFKSFPNDAERKKDLVSNLRAAPRDRSRLISVEMTAATPDDARDVLVALIAPYLSKLERQQEAAERNQMELLRSEKTKLEFELESVVKRQLNQKETELGMEGVELFGSWNSKRLQYERMLQTRSEVKANLAGLTVQKENLDRTLRDGKTPAEVNNMLSRDGRYLSAQERVDLLEIEIDQLALTHGEKSEIVVRYKKRLASYKEKLDGIREQLRSDYAESLRTMLENQIVAADANLKSIQGEIDRLNSEMGRLNQAVEQYRMLKQREAKLREDAERYDREIRRVAEFRIAGLKDRWKQADWHNPPQKPDSPTFPKLIITMPLAIVVALALSLGIAFLRELTDTTVRSPRDIAKVGQLTLLGLIPHESDDPEAAAAGRLPLAILDAPNSHIAEQFRQMRTRLQYAHSLDTTRSLLITSPSPDDGKTTVAANLAASLALNGRRILLVDANFRRPTLHGVFNVPNEVGFGDVLPNLDRMADAVRDTEVPNLSVLVAGTKPANATELLESQYFSDFVERALEEFDHVIFDSGPLLMVADAIAMAPRVDGVVTVVRARGNSRGLLQRLRDELRRVKAEHLGVVLNAVRSQGGGYYGRNIKSYYAYQQNA
jgi:capsular exopolysaccharide synthesis family protein